MTVTQCGNFGVLGHQSGAITKISLQSGKEKNKFMSQHADEVTGLGVDVLNRHLVSSSLDKTIKLWDFYRGKLMISVDHGAAIENLCYNRLNDLVAISTSDLSLSLLNVKTGLKRVRHFPDAATNKITDICFSQDSKWLLTSSMDRCIRVWDVVTGSLLDWIEFKSAPLSLDFSPSGEFLATAHLNSRAVFLWSNKAFFQ